MVRSKPFSVRVACLASATCLLLAAALPSVAQETQAPAPSWLIQDILPAAKAEGALTVFGSMNEQEALPLWKIFQDATGIPVSYIRGSDAQLTGRIEIEARTQKNSWDLLVTTGVTRLPAQIMAPFDPPQAQGLIPQGRASDKRWYGVYANYNVPAYNTQFVKAADLPKTYEDFLKHPEWAGHVGITDGDYPWMASLFDYYGKDKGQDLLKKLIATLKPAPVDGHLALARGVASGEYWIALNNFINLTINTQMSGSPTDYWGIDPIALILGQVAMDVKAPHPKSALLAANFLVSKEGQSTIVKNGGRLPVRADVPPIPPDAITKLGSHKVLAIDISPQDEKTWAGEFKELFH
ncbi:MAG TPA: extracellular solute-binding protein [Beijerinckiaceae bacterium]|nr:extracellular solute-binding protein [Beijerinckiaceae bacterium]